MTSFYSEQHRFNSLVEAIPMPAAIYTGKNMVVTIANEAMLKVWGRDSSVFGKTLKDAFPELEGQPYPDLLQHVFITGEPYQTKEGRADLMINGKLQTVYFNINYRPLIGSDGKTEAIISTSADVTELVLARQKMEEAEERLSFALNAAEIGTWDLDPINYTVQWDERCRELFGFRKDGEITYDEVRDCMHPDDKILVHKAVIAAISAGTKNDYDIRYRTLNHYNGQTRWVHCKGMAYFKPDSDIAYRFAGTARDVTEEVEARKILADKHLALQNAVKELEFLADSVPSVVWTSTPDGLLDYINKRWYEHGSRAMEDTLGTGWAAGLHPDDRAAASAACGEALKTGNPYQIEFRIMDKTGEYRWWLVRALPLRDDDNKIVKWYGTNTDITEQKELSRQKDNFLGVASHELKTPITSIKAYAQVMEKMFIRAGDTKNAELVAKMDKQVVRLNNLIGDLLDVTKINSGRLQFNFEKFDFNKLVDEVTEDVQRTTSKHVIKKQLNAKNELTGDKDRITQVVTNLLTNAIKYSPAANEIIIYTEDHEDEVQLCVQDFGIGISADKKDKVFEQFYRVSGSKEYTFPGLGLGLYISAEIVKRLGGRIWVTSVEGKGSTFCFSIPVKPK